MANGTTVSFTKTYTSAVSQEEADALAAADADFTAEGQAHANEVGTCPAP